MPYYIYQIGRLNLLEQLGVEDSFRDAKARTTELRAQLSLGPGEQIRMIFAANELEAEDLLSQPSQASDGVFGDD
ncbi:MAG: hypothetical protein P8009_00860 [Gammaproteobacteria bacterium]|nr:hypothetical protein [Gammaproteobacteria bacterium]